ncbi:sushi domain-containing protein 3-like isoform X1 [Dryobates pubescens]|uniref:sushi domain-containing protein 3-like isoform X1 n=1 Tax=Dryobates pubescens TaxID=118200 RepID=UPI0023B8ED29|nr:sushi domain-containing protein 3-like isoform X1 [Dryobates pubescens]
MTGQRLGKCIALCLLPWSCLSFACSEAAGPQTALLGAGHSRKRLPRDAANGTYMHSNSSAPCTALSPPRYGYYYVERGSGVSLGSVLVYWCQEGYQLVGSQRLSCLRREGASSWSHPPPLCQAASQPSVAGSRAAVAASLLSGAVILVLSVAFAVCCWRDRARRSRGGQQHRRKGRWVRDPSTPERGRNAFGRLRHYHRRDYHLSALSSSVFPGAFAGCNNLAFQRSPENLPKLPLRSWHPEALPQLVLQPGTAPIAALPGQPPRNILLPAVPCRADLPRDPLPLYYRSYEEHKVFKKFGRPG